MLFHKSLNIPVPGLIFSLLGLGWCIFMSLGIAAEFTCITSGCSVVENVRVFGISPWWAAAALFGLMALFALLRLRTLAYLVALFFLLGDCLFLLVMLFLAPCTNCLILALLLFCAWLSLRSKFTTLVVPRRVFAGVMSGLWLLLFLFNIGPVLNELVPPRPLLEKPDSPIAVYISPSCPACLHAVRNFEGAAEFYALAKNEEDLALVADLQSRLAAGSSLTAAMEDMTAGRKAGTYRAPELSLWQELDLRFALMRNQARLSRLGIDVLPVIMFEGLPASWAKPRQVQTGPGPALPPAQRQPLAPAAPTGSTGSTTPATPTGAGPVVPDVSGQSVQPGQPERAAENSAAGAEGQPDGSDKAAYEEFLRQHRASGGCVNLEDFILTDPADPENGETAPGEAAGETAPGETSGETADEAPAKTLPPAGNGADSNFGLPDLPGELLDPVLDCGQNRTVPCD